MGDQGGSGGCAVGGPGVNWLTVQGGECGGGSGPRELKNGAAAEC